MSKAPRKPARFPAPPPRQASPADAAIAKLLALIKTSLDDDKAEDIAVIDLRGQSTIADFMVLASGRSQRHVAAVAEKLGQRIKDASGRSARIEGLPQADWVLVDAGDIIIHVFRPDVRTHYALEKMWSPSLAPR
ncbi:MAG: ribosome silencing factor [Alphaproteobacteria bacterium]|nr:ribosome silencing factor [Alphaproteobacteria bacterium]